MTQYTVQPLNEKTWPDFERLVDANNGVWGGCWCMWYHGKPEAEGTPAEKKAAKKCRVKRGAAHAALVYEGPDCVGWCQFGSPEELPRIHTEKAYLATDPTLPQWRITCFFSGKGHRGNGVASTALEGAIEQIRRLGGVASRAIRKTPTDERLRPRFCSTVRSPPSSAVDSGGSGRLENTNGWWSAPFERRGRFEFACRSGRSAAPRPRPGWPGTQALSR